MFWIWCHSSGCCLLYPSVASKWRQQSYCITWGKHCNSCWEETVTSRGEVLEGALSERQVGSDLMLVDLPGIIRLSSSLCMDKSLPLGCCYLWHMRHAEQRLAPSLILLTVQPQLWLISIYVNTLRLTVVSHIEVYSFMFMYQDECKSCSVYMKIYIVNYTLFI